MMLFQHQKTLYNFHPNWMDMSDFSYQWWSCGESETAERSSSMINFISLPAWKFCYFKWSILSLTFTSGFYNILKRYYNEKVTTTWRNHFWLGRTQATCCCHILDGARVSFNWGVGVGQQTPYVGRKEILQTKPSPLKVGRDKKIHNADSRLHGS